MCAELNKRLEHPKKCDVYVMCIDGGTKKYAFGIACGNAQCTNSEIGACSNNCSSNCSKDTLGTYLSYVGFLDHQIGIFYFNCILSY